MPLRHAFAALAALLLGSPPAAPTVAVTVEGTDARLRADGGVLRLGDAPLTGVVLERDRSGAVRRSTPYRAGVRDGVERSWYADGAPRLALTYRAGLPHGAGREWYADGRPYREMRYAAGHEEGMQRVWWPDGRVRASYVVRDGRRYGLMGAKGCVTE